MEEKGFKGWTSKISPCHAEPNLFKKHTSLTSLPQLNLNKEFRMEMLYPCERHAFKHCIILGQEGFIGWTSKISRCDTEPDFLLKLNFETKSFAALFRLAKQWMSTCVLSRHRQNLSLKYSYYFLPILRVILLCKSECQPIFLKKQDTYSLYAKW